MHTDDPNESDPEPAEPESDPDTEPEVDPGSIEALRARKSVGRISDEHWTRARADQNQEAIEYYRERSRAPGVAEGGGTRAHYCMSCDGVIPLEYDSRTQAPREPGHCPHCGVELDRNVRRMFNWVEIDQVPDSDAAALLPWFLGAGAVLAFVVWLLL